MAFLFVWQRSGAFERKQKRLPNWQPLGDFEGGVLSCVTFLNVAMMPAANIIFNCC